MFVVLLNISFYCAVISHPTPVFIYRCFNKALRYKTAILYVRETPNGWTPSALTSHCTDEKVTLDQSLLFITSLTLFETRWKTEYSLKPASFL